MNYDWHIEYQRDFSPSIKEKIIEHAEFLMNYFFKKLEDHEEYSIEMMSEVFKTIIEEMGCMRCRVDQESLVIEYSKSVNIIIEDSKTQLYRGLKLQKILK